jgi:hypothetical protein
MLYLDDKVNTGDRDIANGVVFASIEGKTSRLEVFMHL